MGRATLSAQRPPPLSLMLIALLILAAHAPPPSALALLRAGHSDPPMLPCSSSRAVSCTVPSMLPVQNQAHLVWSPAPHAVSRANTRLAFRSVGRSARGTRARTLRTSRRIPSSPPRFNARANVADARTSLRPACPRNARTACYSCRRAESQLIATSPRGRRGFEPNAGTGGGRALRHSLAHA